MSTPEPAQAHQAYARASRQVLALLVLLNLVVVSMTMVSLRWNRRHLEEAAVTTAMNLTQVLEHHMVGDIQKIDLALFSLRQEMARQRAAGGIRTEALNAYIHQLFTQFPELSSIRTANAEGRIDHGIGVQPGTHFSVADRPYFQEAKRNPKAGLMISPPVVGRISGQWVVIFGRRIDLEGGGFGGVAYVAEALDQFTKSMVPINLGPHGVVTLRGGDLELYARYPMDPALGDLTGKRVISAAFLELFRQGRTSGAYKAHAGFDGVERTFAFTKVGEYPLYLHVGLASEDYLAQYRAEARRSWSVVALFLVCSAGLAWLLLRAWVRERNRALAEVRELRGLLPICATCKKIRDDEGYWNQIETYVQARSSAHFTHGICPDCSVKLLAEFHAGPKQR